MTLSPQDRERIYEEEKAKKEIQSRLSHEEALAAKAADRRRMTQLWRGCLIVIALAFVLSVIGSLMKSRDTTIQTSPTIHASAEFTGTQIVVVNQDSFDWTGVEMIIDVGILSGYAYNAERLRAGHTYTIGAAQFVDQRGVRFNPFTHKPQTLTITGKTPAGDAAWAGRWK